MPVTAIDVVRKFARNANPAYVQAFENGSQQLLEKGIDRPLRLAHFMAQVLHETDGLTVLVENGAYNAKNLGDMWDSGNWHSYFDNRDACVAMSEQCRIDKGVALFSLVYGDRMGNGPKETKDGWTYRGRGILQTTGRESYRKFGRKCGVDFEGNPDLIISAEHALKPALAEWEESNLNAAADRDDIVAVTKGINGGTVGLKSRREWLARIRPFITGSAGAPEEESIEWRVQEALNKAGFNCGEPDGDIGKNSRAAIEAYRRAKGLPVRPDITPDLLQSLGVR